MRFELKLRSIRLQNFRLFNDLQVDFDEQLTVFISENGSGKTSLLEGIAKALNVFLFKIVNGGETKDIPVETAMISDKKDIQYGKNGAMINITTNFVKYKKKSILSWRLISVPYDGAFSHKLLDDTFKKLSLVVEEIRLGYKNFPVIMYYASDRNYLKSAQEVTSIEGFSNIYDNSLNGKVLNFKEFLEWYIWHNQVGLFKKTENSILKQVKLAVLSMLNDDDSNVFDDMYIDPTQYKNPRLMISKLGNQLEVNQLSSGEKSLFVLVSDLARRLCLANPQSTDPLKEGQGVVLIDEIDLHLHPQWQRKVLTKLKTIFPKIQWIVTSHSPLVLSYAPAGKVFKLSNGQVQEYKHFRGMRLMDIFYDLYNIKSRPQLIQNQIDALFESVDSENWQKAQTQLNELKLILPEHDPAIVEAQTSLKLAS